MSDEEKLTAAQLVLEFFEGDAQKACHWWATPNPLLGAVSPDRLCELGREAYLLKWVRA